MKNDWYIDLLVAGGVAAIACGLWWLYPPAVLLWLGGCMLAAGILGAIR